MLWGGSSTAGNEQNEGQPLERLYRAVKALLSVVPAKAHIRQACTTGYGADLARAALGAAFSEVETLAPRTRCRRV